MSNKKEYRPWDRGHEQLPDAVKGTRDTKEIKEGELAVEGVREKMKGVLKKDQSLKVSMYVPEPEPVRAEGEVWTDNNNRTWILKNGKKEAHSVMQDAKRPWWCPKCEKGMNSRADDRMWILRGKCFDCVLKEETQMRLDGSWEKYEKERMLGNQIAYMRDRIMELKDIQRTISNPENHFANGTFERWNIGIDQIKADMQGEIDQLEGLLTQAETLYQAEFGSKETT